MFFFVLRFSLLTRITAYFNPVKLCYFFLPVDIYCVFVIYSKTAAFKKKEKCNFFSLFRRRKIQGLGKRNFFFYSFYPCTLLACECSSSKPISWFCMPMLNTSYFSNKLMVRIANRRLFSYTFSCVLLSRSLLQRLLIHNKRKIQENRQKK